MFNRKDFGARLRQLRQEEHKSQQVLADFLGVTTTQISDLEQGKTGTTLERLVMLCEYYQVSSDYLLGLSSKK